MSSWHPITFRHVTSRPRSTSDSSLQTFPPERYSDLVRRRGGLISVPGNLTPSTTESKDGDDSQKVKKLLLNVNIERSVGPVQVIMSPDNTVRDLMKAAVEIYVKEKRRPLLNQIDSSCFDLHYSQFSLECLKREEKLINLGSRNFFMCLRRTANTTTPSSMGGCCSEEAKLGKKCWLRFIGFMEALL